MDVILRAVTAAVESLDQQGGGDAEGNTTAKVAKTNRRARLLPAT
jgi:hypothetical protein